MEVEDCENSSDVDLHGCRDSSDWATIPNPTRPRVADSGTPYRYIG